MKHSSLMKAGLPLLILIGAIVVAAVMIKSRKPPEQKPVEEKAFLVSAEPVNSEQVQFTVESQGNVLPKHQTRLSSQVSGRVVWLNDQFVVGGMVRQGDVLAELEKADYETDVRLAEAELAQAKAALEEEIARGKVAQEEWRSVNSVVPPELGLRKPQLASQQASVKAAEAKLERARRNLERATIRAPYNAIIIERNIDVGQFVSVGANIGLLNGTDVAEVRLPITDSDLAFLNVSANPESVENVRLTARVAGKVRTWQGRLARTEGVLDNTSRVVYAIVEVRDPYQRETSTNDSAILRFGQFVQAEIQGEKSQQLFVLPRNVVRLDGTVLSVTEDRVIDIKSVETIRTTPDKVFVASGLDEGDMVVLSAVPNPYSGMKVRLPGEEPAVPPEAKNDKADDPDSIASEQEGE
ncbi:efflux RND transporter periplasmic adaptor subunit [Alteromonas sp. CYL-A6]|uniref:efflux RND transporter periplasmic adaptor subunit n=1 Tax=Alteromonas nitratireducens TaxID=3390813 RepID=UPI0034B349F6